jgi:hypothetical protein
VKPRSCTTSTVLHLSLSLAKAGTMTERFLSCCGGAVSNAVMSHCTNSVLTTAEGAINEIMARNYL